MKNDRIILHCDLNGFYASVEAVLHPQFKNVPMAVCGDPASRHGIILAKNELAKKFGIKTAETVFTAKRKCPELVLAPPHHEEYVKFSRWVNQIYLTKTDLVEPFGIDESWLDVTNTAHLFGTGRQIADQLRHEVFEKTGLTLSVGVSFNKVFAKLGSDYKKPDATTEISLENFQDILWPLPAQSMLFVGKKAQKTLDQMYIKTIGDLAHADPRLLTARLGKLGTDLSRYANGQDNAPVASYFDRPLPKSVGNGLTYRRNLLGSDDIKAALQGLCDDVAFRLKSHGLMCRAVSVSIKSPDFATISRQRTLDFATDLSKELFQCSLQLVMDNWNLESPIRALTVTAMQVALQEEEGDQLSLFGSQTQNRSKQKSLENAIDRLRQKFGTPAIESGIRINRDIDSFGGDAADSKNGEE